MLRSVSQSSVRRFASRPNAGSATLQDYPREHARVPPAQNSRPPTRRSRWRRRRSTTLTAEVTMGRRAGESTPCQQRRFVHCRSRHAVARPPQACPINERPVNPRVSVAEAPANWWRAQRSESSLTVVTQSGAGQVEVPPSRIVGLGALFAEHGAQLTNCLRLKINIRPKRTRSG